MIDRRQLLKTASTGFGYLAFAGLAAEQAQADNPLASRSSHFAPRAKRVIFLCMRGGPSHMETFDYKPKLNADDGKPSKNKNQKFFGSQWKFRQRGESGLWISDLLPHTARVADELCVLNGMHCDSPEHAAALTQLHTGSIQFERPSIGAWVMYGLGTENQDLPGFVSIKPPVILGGARNYGSAFLPSIYQGTPIGTMSQSIKLAKIDDVGHPSLSSGAQRQRLDFLQRLNRNAIERRGADGKVESLIESYELAFRMQTALPQALDINRETKQTLDMYGIGDKRRTDDFGRQCLMARRLAEAGVRPNSPPHNTSVSSNKPRRLRSVNKAAIG